MDIGQVDLIVSFDASTSPIRNIQRAGRTGRKRSGRVVLLVSAGQFGHLFVALLGVMAVGGFGGSGHLFVALLGVMAEGGYVAVLVMILLLVCSVVVAVLWVLASAMMLPARAS